MKLGIIILALLIAGCTQESGIANPAAVFCASRNYTYELRGNEGFCVFNNNSECPEWDYYYGNCAPETINDNEPVNNTNKLTFDNYYPVTDPVVNFTESDITYLGVNCAGTDSEIADCIAKWQTINIDYCYPGDPRADCTDPMRFNYMLQGIYPTNEIIRELRDTKIYGICFTYAGIYCSIANYYGLECRVVNSITKPSERTGNTFGITGMSPTEFDRLKIKLEANNYDYDYEMMRLIARETPEHYWAEVYLDGEWIVKDASVLVTGYENPKTSYIALNDYEVTNWTKLDPNPKIELYNKGELIEEVITSENNYIPDTTNYTGITDDLGNNRATNIDDYMQGRGLAPYYNSCNDTCNFFKNTIPYCLSDCELEFYTCYEECSGENAYKVCDYICGNEANISNCYKACSGEELNLNCYLGC